MPRQPTVTEEWQRLLVGARRLNSDSKEAERGEWGPETANSYHGAVMHHMQGIWPWNSLEVSAREQPAVMIPELAAALEAEAASFSQPEPAGEQKEEQPPANEDAEQREESRQQGDNDEDNEDENEGEDNE